MFWPLRTTTSIELRHMDYKYTWQVQLFPKYCWDLVTMSFGVPAWKTICWLMIHGIILSLNGIRAFHGCLSRIFQLKRPASSRVNKKPRLPVFFSDSWPLHPLTASFLLWTNLFGEKVFCFTIFLWTFGRHGDRW